MRYSLSTLFLLVTTISVSCGWIVLTRIETRHLIPGPLSLLAIAVMILTPIINHRRWLLSSVIGVELLIAGAIREIHVIYSSLDSSQGPVKGVAWAIAQVRHASAGIVVLPVIATLLFVCVLLQSPSIRNRYAVLMLLFVSYIVMISYIAFINWSIT